MCGWGRNYLSSFNLHSWWSKALRAHCGRVLDERSCWTSPACVSSSGFRQYKTVVQFVWWQKNVQQNMLYCGADRNSQCKFRVSTAMFMLQKRNLELPSGWFNLYHNVIVCCTVYNCLELQSQCKLIPCGTLWNIMLYLNKKKKVKPFRDIILFYCRSQLLDRAGRANRQPFCFLSFLTL